MCVWRKSAWRKALGELCLSLLLLVLSASPGHAAASDGGEEGLLVLCVVCIERKSHAHVHVGGGAKGSLTAALLAPC